MKRKSNKASGCDDMCIDVVKHTADVLSKPLAFILDTSFANRLFPDSLKIAQVIPIHKNGDRDCFSNY